MTLADIAAKLTGLTDELTALKADKTEASAALAKETEARKALETELTALKAKAEAAPPPNKQTDDDQNGQDEPSDIKECIANLEKAIAEWHKAAAPGDDEESKAEDSSDMEDNEACKAARSAKLWPKAIAIRTRQLSRKQAFVKNRGNAQKAFDDKVAKAVTAQIATLGIPALTLRKPEDDELKKQKPDGEKRATALIARGFNSQPAIAALNVELGRKSRY